MFIRHDTYTTSNAVCYKSVDDLSSLDFQYFDKDGFELNVAEQKFYSAMNFPITHNILNHTCWQVPWYTLPKNDHGLFLDHAMVLQRCAYQGAAEEQIRNLTDSIPSANLLLQIKPKWGYDFDLNGVAEDGTVYEILHVEYDTVDRNVFLDKVVWFEQFIKYTDWVKIAAEVWESRDEWQHLKGFDQNHWKAQHILGWDKSEYLEKVIN